MHENRETSEMPTVNRHDRPAGEGDSRTTRMHVSEESDSGVVPMNRSNNDGQPLAESHKVGGRLFRLGTGLQPMGPGNPGGRAEIGAEEGRLSPIVLFAHPPEIVAQFVAKHDGTASGRRGGNGKLPSQAPVIIIVGDDNGIVAVRRLSTGRGCGRRITGHNRP